MREKLNLTGMRFGNLIAIEPLESVHGNVIWRCKCDCGKETKVKATRIKSGHTKSCGCGRSKPVVEHNFKHGLTHSRLFTIWNGMRGRCQDSKSISYPNYGARGISVCSEWTEFKIFYEWAISNGYADNLTIDRIDGNGNYEPTNCRWVTHTTQNNNRCNNRIIAFNNESHTLAEWARLTGVNYKVLHYRIQNGWNLERAFSPKVLKGENK